MKAYLLQEPGFLTVENIPEPAPANDGVVLRTRAVSLCATDISYFRGHLFPESWPIIPGHEYVGTVVDKGPNCDDLALGDVVVYWGQTDFGGLAEYRAVRPILPGSKQSSHWFTERHFMDDSRSAGLLLNKVLPVSYATLIEPVTSLLRSILLNPPMPGDRVAILGAGPCGLIAVQLFKNTMGAGHVTVVDINQGRLDIARELGADTLFNLNTDHEFVSSLITDHQSDFTDYVFDALPNVEVSSSTLNPRTVGMSLLRPKGKYIIYGATEIPQLIDTWMILAKGLQVCGTPFDVRAFPMYRSAHVMRVAANLIESGLIQVAPLITSRLDFNDADSIKAAFENYGHGATLKTCIDLLPVQSAHVQASSQLLQGSNQEL